MRKFVMLIVASGLSLGVGGAYAQETKKDEMKKDQMMQHDVEGA